MSKMKILSRREFIKLTGLATGGLALSLNGAEQFIALSDAAIKKLALGPGNKTRRTSVCRLCPGGCSLSVLRVDGIPISLKGNPLSPINRGGLCPAAHANMEILYHPDRFIEPKARPEGLIRKSLDSVPWESIQDSTANLISELIKRKQGYKVAIINGEDTHIMRDVWQKFADAIGTPNIYHTDYSGLNDNSTGMIHGYPAIPSYDLINSECIISLGANFLEEDGAPVHFNQVYGQFKDVKNITRKKLIYVGPRANITASSANRWIPSNPDTWGTLALGILHVLISESSLDLEHIRSTSNGFFNYQDSDGEELLGIENQIRSDFHPKNVEAITGVSESDIHYLAGLIQTRPNCAIVCGSEALRSPRGSLHQWAVHCLNYLVGNIQTRGGFFYPEANSRTNYSPNHLEKGEIQNLFYADEINPSEKPSLDLFAKRVEGYAPYKIEVLIINKANPGYEGEDKTKWKATLKHIPRVVFIGDLPNETSAHSDVILPTHSELESWNLVESIPTIPFDSASLQRPVINPMYNTKSSYEILKGLVDRIDEIDDNLFSSVDSKKLVQNRLKEIYAEKRGALFTDYSEDEWTETYKSHQSMAIDLSEKNFMKGMLTSGGWWNPEGSASVKFSNTVQTNSKKLELLSTALLGLGHSNGSPSQLLKNLLGTAVYPSNLMQYNNSDGDGFPLTLISGFPNTNPHGKTIYSPSLLESFGVLREIYWEAWAEIHPETAHKYGIADGEIIQIDSQVGQIKARARVRPIILPDVVFVPMGLGRENVGRFGSGIGEDPRKLMAPQPEISTGNMIISGTPIRISNG
ncbi:MAG: molybdopterin-dependent oxidoreductase [Candidatus Marinimicrobia bacterium]|nr:molybdopterin-dependent oxidoreductase [Candidatus Neomarinimicrobiota bacterium]